GDDRPRGGGGGGGRLHQGRRRDQGHARNGSRPPQGLSAAIYHRAGGITYLRVLASRAPARRSSAVPGRFANRNEAHISVMALATLCLARARRTGDSARIKHGVIYRSFPPKRGSSLSPQSGTPLSRE